MTRPVLKRTKHKDVLRLITAIRLSHPDITYLYTEGRCYDFFLILRSVFPDAEPYYNGQHVYSLIDGRFYDITGVYLGDKKKLYPLCHLDGHRPHRWAKSDKRILK